MPACGGGPLVAALHQPRLPLIPSHIPASGAKLACREETSTLQQFLNEYYRILSVNHSVTITLKAIILYFVVGVGWLICVALLVSARPVCKN